MNSSCFEIDVAEIARAELRTLPVRAISDADRDDMEQEARIGVWKALRRIEAAGCPSTSLAYLGMSARSNAIEYLRWRGRRVRREAPIESAIGVATHGTIDGSAIYSEIDRVEKILDRAGLTILEREVFLAVADLEPETEAVRGLSAVQRRRKFGTARRKIRDAMVGE